MKTAKRERGRRRKRWASGFLALVLGGLLGQGATPTVDITRVGQWPGHARGPTQSVAIAGDYAYVTVESVGLQVIDIRDPRNPVVVGGVNGVGWAWDVAVAGDYVYACGDAGLQVIDIRDPQNPVQVGGVDIRWARCVAVAGDYAYVCGRAGLQVIDISKPRNPVRVGGVDTPGWPVDVAVVDNYVYIASGVAGLQVIDVRDPRNPVQVGRKFSPGDGVGVTVVGGYAYVADGGLGLQVIDVRDPARPVRGTRVPIFGYATDVAVADGYAYVAGHKAGLQVIDIRDPRNPVRVGGVDTADWALGVAVAGGYAYLVDLNAGLQVIDIRDPRNPVRVGGVDTADGALGVAVAGDYAYVADNNAGLQVIDIRDPANPRRVGNYLVDGGALSLAVVDDYVYVVNWTWGLQIFQVSEGGGTLQVSLNPPGAVEAGARWRRAGTTEWRASGATESGIAPGPVTLEFKPAPGWVTPAPREVTLTAGETTTVSVTYERAPASATLAGWVIGRDRRGRASGPLPGARVTLADGRTAITDDAGGFRFPGLAPGEWTVTASHAGYLSASRVFTLAAGETRQGTVQLAEDPPAGVPAIFDFTSPNGRHFIAGLPGAVSFAAQVVWNGAPGMVRFRVGEEWFPAMVIDLGNGRARVSVTVPLPAALTAQSELAIETRNGEGQRFTWRPGVYFHPAPGIVTAWYGPSLAWERAGASLTVTKEASWRLWQAEIPSGVYRSAAWVGMRRQLRYDPWSGTFSGTLGGFGKFTQTLEFDEVESLGEGRLDLSGSLTVTLAGNGPPVITPAWEARLSGKAGIGAPAVLVVDAVFPPAGPVVHTLLKVPVVKEVVGALKLRLFLIGGLGLRGEYTGEQAGECFLGSSSLDLSGTLGLEGQAALEAFGAEAGVYVGGTGTPEFQICPDWAFEGLTLRAYVGVFASAWLFEFSEEVGAEVRFGPDGQRRLLGEVPREWPADAGAWEPIGRSGLRWGEMNRPGPGRSARRLQSRSLAESSGSLETLVVGNVTRLAAPSLAAQPDQSLLLFSRHDPDKPWYAATDVGAAAETEGGPWSLGQLTDDLAAEFSPRIADVGAGLRLAAWSRVAGDIAGATDPGDVAPHLETVAAWRDPDTGEWTAPVQLTSNAVVDRDPLPAWLGGAPAVLWVQNAGAAGIGNADSGDRLLLAAWSGTAWEAPQALWSGSKGILGVAAIADATGEGHVLFAVDEDGDSETRDDRELYAVATVNGVWQPAVRLTDDDQEEALPVLVAPEGAPLAVWSAGGTLVYTPLSDWQPRPVYRAETLANEAPTLAGVTLPGGAAVAYAVQGPNGVDIVAAFYDAALDQWSLPRQLTQDEHVESALALASDGNELVLAYLKTQTVRTGLEVEINGETQHLENVPQPGRTDLFVLRHALGNDPAVAPGSLQVEPPNPAPGMAATLRTMIENRGDLPITGVQVAFYDGDPATSGTIIGEAQTLAETLVGGAQQEVTVPWTVPAGTNAHTLYVVVDPQLAIEDRDRANNHAAVETVLPDLEMLTARSTEVSATSIALMTTLTNAGVIPTGPFVVSWRLGAVKGEEIGRSEVGPLAPGQTFEVAHQWNTAGRHFSSAFVTVYAVADSRDDVREWDETNNAYPQSVRVIPGWAPRLLGLAVKAGGRVRWTIEAPDATTADLIVESAASLGTQVAWSPETEAEITATGEGRFAVKLPARGDMRFYRVRIAP